MARVVWRWLDGIVDRCLAVVGAVTFSQIPEFMQQSLQRLAGHTAEAQHQVVLIQQAAQASGKSLIDYMGKFLAHSDPDVIRQGEVIQQTLERARSLKDAFEAIQGANALVKPFVFAAKMPYAIAKATLDNFHPAVPISPENLIYAFIGILFALGLYQLAVRLPVRLFLIKPSPRRRRYYPRS